MAGATLSPALQAQEAGTVRFSARVYRVTEGEGPLTVELRRGGDVSAAARVVVRTVPGSAKPGLDYTAVRQVVRFGRGSDRASFSVPVLDDELGGKTRAFSVVVEGETRRAAPLASARVLILEDDVPQVCMAEGEERLLAEWSGTAPLAPLGIPDGAVNNPFEVPAGCRYDQLAVTIDWGSDVEDLDLDVVGPTGEIVGSSAAGGTNTETALIATPQPGGYVSVTKSFANANTAYTGKAVLRCSTTGGCLQDLAVRPPRPLPKDTRVIVADIDSAINPYHEFFYEGSRIYPDRAPSSVSRAVLAELGVRPENVVKLTRTGDLAADIAADQAFWDRVKPGELYHFVGTNLVVTALHGGPVFLKPDPAKSAHGVGTGGAVLAANPEAVLLFVEVNNSLGSAASHGLAFRHPAVDIITTSYGVSLGVPGVGPIPGTGTGFPAPETAAFLDTYRGVVLNGKLHFSSGGNGSGLTPLRAGAGPWWSIGVSGFEEDSSNGDTQVFSGNFPDFVSDFTQELPYCHTAQDCYVTQSGTSFSTPRAAGVASRVLLEARRSLGHRGGIVDIDGQKQMAAGQGKAISNWFLRRSLEQAAYVPGIGEYDPVEGVFDLGGTPINPIAPWLQIGWGDLTANPNKGVVKGALTHLGFGTAPVSKGTGFCEFQTEVVLARKQYWDEVAPNLPSVFGGETTGSTPEVDPFLWCASGLPNHPESNDPGGTPAPAEDQDGDGIVNEADNCPEAGNADQRDTDGDGQGDVCDVPPPVDSDGDGISDAMDNCPFVANGQQDDEDFDGIGDACDTNEGQVEPGPGRTVVATFEGSAGTVTTPVICSGCGTDPAFSFHRFRYVLPPRDAYTALEVVLNWSTPAEIFSLEVLDRNGVSRGFAGFQARTARGTPTPGASSLTVTVSEPIEGPYTILVKEDLTAGGMPFEVVVTTICPATGCNGEIEPPPPDQDGDGVPDAQDNCPAVSNPMQTDSDNDGVGDACETAPADGDGDGVPDATDNCPAVPNSDQVDSNGDGIG
ncbi:MAG TPA: thrombospondin type 3 repeat-containing protein, partial [Nevskiaceae bacterium]|nr:thrombospondin type 3 repeat-containing protein [Nevskiaceae bacterium]